MRRFLKNAFVPTESEYRANHAGLNTFFGAVLGFVLAGTEALDTFEFAMLLFLVSGVVVSILYISASTQTYAYAALSVVMILCLPRITDRMLDDGESLPRHLQATLMVWAVMSVVVELFPRRPDETPPAAP